MPEGGASREGRLQCGAPSPLSSVQRGKTAEGADFSSLNWHSRRRCTQTHERAHTLYGNRESQGVLGSHAWKAQSFVCLLNVWEAGENEGGKKKKNEEDKKDFCCFHGNNAHKHTHTHTHVMSVRARAWCLVSLIQCQLFSLAAIWCIILKHGLLGCTVSSRREADWQKKKKKKGCRRLHVSLGLSVERAAPPRR